MLPLLAGLGPWWTAALSLVVAALLPAALMPLLGLGRRGSRLGGGTHVLITGGSKGLGLELGRLCAARGCSVTLVARNQKDLDAALLELQAAAATAAGRGRRGSSSGDGAGSTTPTPKLQALSADTADPAKLRAVVEQAEQAAGPIEVLICNAGLSVPGLFIEQDPEVFEHQMRVNYLGTVNTVQAVLPGMLRQRRGRVVVVTSGLAILGFAGYCSYAPTKWALRGLADCLRNELLGTGVEVSIAYPPDMDTPGYAIEMETKPELCNAVNKAMGNEVFPPDKVARCLLGGIERGAYHLPTPDLGLNMLVASMTSLRQAPSASSCPSKYCWAPSCRWRRPCSAGSPTARRASTTRRTACRRVQALLQAGRAMEPRPSRRARNGLPAAWLQALLLVLCPSPVISCAR